MISLHFLDISLPRDFRGRQPTLRDRLTICSTDVRFVSRGVCKPVCLGTLSSIPPPSPYPRSSNGNRLLLIVGHHGKRKGLWVAIPLRLSHPTNVCVRVLPALGSPAPSDEVKFTQLSDGKLPAKEMYPDINESALMRRIDMRVIPILSAVYFLAYLDRVNIANAAVYGMSKHLGLTGNQFNVALTIL